MRRTFFALIAMTSLTVFVAATSAGDGRAAAGGAFELTWHTIDGGGGTSAGGAFALSGTFGQPDAGVMNGGSFTLHGGYWTGAGGTGTPPCTGDLNGSG